MSGFRYTKDAEGIVTVTMDLNGPVNAMNGEYFEEMGRTVDRLEKEEDLNGVILASAKSTFFAGGDLRELMATAPGTQAQFMAHMETIKRQLRRLEKLPVPVVAAINGAALGGGYEIALACNRRIVLNDPLAVVGLPEVTLGLLPGGGGIVRLVNLLGLETALPYLLEGTRAKPAEALKAGLIDEIVERAEDLIPAARAFIKAQAGAGAQPWDRRTHKIPGGTMAQPHIAQFVSATAVTLSKKTRGLLPAPERALAVAAETTIVDFDTALRIETRGFTSLVMTPQAKNIINTMFFQMKDVQGGASRPKSIAQSKVRKLGVLGAGMMGQGIAYVSALAGIEVVLRDVTLEAAEKGKAYSEKLLRAAVEKGRMDEAAKVATLGLIRPIVDVTELEGCDLIIEAVFENLELKARVTKEADRYLTAGGVFASNTSTLPIGLLAQAAQQPESFIGIHFFSPVDKMQLVEIICGEKTSPMALAAAFDYTRQIGKTAIVVNDSLGFFTSRTFGTYLDEGARLLKEGVNPILIENLGRQIGMPAAPLAVQDEVSQELTRKVAETQRAMGVFNSKADNSVATEVCELLIKDYGRAGRHHGGGYYEYPPGGEKYLWPKLFELFHDKNQSLPEQDIKDRLLFRQVIESIKCLQEGVLRSVADGNVGSILGIGAPMWTGGFIQFVNTFGLERFAQRSAELDKRYGTRFMPPELLLRKAAAGEQFE
jgi:3-hydroxyacyl-CoA dehydrogenase / enoyl-CoA hydratase / 3-hydroxybutyryl-CoA epimerase